VQQETRRYYAWSQRTFRHVVFEIVSTLCCLYRLNYCLNQGSETKCFYFVDLSVCLSVTRLLKKLWIIVHGIFRRGRPWTKNGHLDFWDDLHSDLDPVVLFLLHLFAVFK